MLPTLKTPKFIDEFKAFAIKGNVIDLAVGVIIGAAFGKVVSSLVSDLIQPIISLIVGGKDFSNLFFTLSKGEFATLDAAKKAGAVTVNYGMFLNAIIDFTIIAFVIFLLVKVVSKVRREPEKVDPDERPCPRCLTTVKKAATRCPACTSDIPAVVVAAAAPAAAAPAGNTPPAHA